MRVGAVLSLAVLACTNPGTPMEPASSGDKKTSKVAAELSVRLTGVLVPVESVDVSSVSPGVLAKVLVEVGDPVKPDQVVAILERSRVLDQQRAAQAARSVAIANRRQAELDLLDAKRRLAVETHGVESGISSVQSREDSAYVASRAEVALSRARAAEALEAARVDEAKGQADRSELRVPFAGVVARRFHDPGNAVEQGTPVVRVVSATIPQVRFAALPEQAASFKRGARVRVYISTIPIPVFAIVKHVSPTVDAASGMVVFEAEFADASQSQELRPGLAAVVESAH